MRMESAAVAKGKRAPLTQLVPRDGTKVRALYDLLMLNKGLPVDLPLTLLYNSGSIEHLRNFYGMDIRKLGYGRWVFAGEWFGPTYLDYVADRIEAAE